MDQRKILSDYCQQAGSKVLVPEGSNLDGTKLLWAIAGNESSFGDWAVPKHEQGYCYGHTYHSAVLSKMFGCAAHCSFGPWQMMFPHFYDCFKGDITPVRLTLSSKSTEEEYRSVLDLTVQAAVWFLNTEILGRQKASTLEQVADAWNSGSWRDNIVPQEYINRAVGNYAVPLSS